MSGWVAGSVVVGSLITAEAGKSSAKKAAAAQVGAAEMGVSEQRRQSDKLQELLGGFTQAGQRAVAGQEELIGLGGPEAQQQAIAALEASPAFEALTRQGEESILQSAAATGGLRGGNVQAALGQFRPQLLSQLIQNQFQNLGGIAQLGQASAAGVGAGGIQTGTNIANLLAQSGQAQAQSQLAQGQATGQLVSGLTGAFGRFMGGRQAAQQQPPPAATQAF